ncbi:hypothetical protein LRS03_13535 [Rhizobacter sp. J219]|uniref:tetratricopeptide repeat protein n=1 Tax=Rhizobacter sp. J219 TaxID=2898430 RepID=UPI0021517054|nr:hypothetical protein [Rhizobacter sp. J219]MCR5883822.1 hypothetical protein [Rhizobacter sp. J219]
MNYQAQLNDLSHRNATYEKVIGGWPVALEGADQLHEVRTLWQADTAHFTAFYQANPNEIEPKLLMADFLRMGHNIDIPDAARHADTVLNEIFRIQEFQIDAILCRAKMYVTLHPSLMAEAEKLFTMVLARSGVQVHPIVHQGLGFACTNQGKFDEARRHFKNYLRLVPGDAKVADLLSKLDAGEIGQMIHVRAGQTAPSSSKTRTAKGGSRPWWKFW